VATTYSLKRREFDVPPKKIYEVEFPDWARRTSVVNNMSSVKVVISENVVDSWYVT